MSSFIITCPHCNTQFEPGDSMRDEIEKELRGKMVDWQKKKEAETTAQLEIEKKRLQTEMQESIKKSIAADYENQIKLLQQNAMDSNEKLKEARKKELDFLQKEQALKNKEDELQLTIQRQLMDEREKMKEELRKSEAEKLSIKEQESQLKIKELEKQKEDQAKLIEEMKRKSEQGSMQLQGEVHELILEQILASSFPFDKIEEVGKGVRGADCIQIVRNQFGNEAGKIIYESKRTKDFSNEWIDKLKKDMRHFGADVAVIVTQTLPKDMERFGEKEGVYICTMAEVSSVAHLLRSAVLKVADAKKSQENKGDKMVMLYDYLIGTEFSEQWKAISEGYRSMRQSIQKERDAMEKMWKAREKQLDKILLNAAHIKGSVEGIAGADAVNLNLLEDDNESLLLD